MFAGSAMELVHFVIEPDESFAHWTCVESTMTQNQRTPLLLIAAATLWVSP